MTELNPGMGRNSTKDHGARLRDTGSEGASHENSPSWPARPPTRISTRAGDAKLHLTQIHPEEAMAEDSLPAPPIRNRTLCQEHPYPRPGMLTHPRPSSPDLGGSGRLPLPWCLPTPHSSPPALPPSLPASHLPSGACP